ncbi:hypothetical protein AAG570_005655 [Ranatra chinensis]|uniref:Uncharacterized protein n=1 Tax=Ranatra chinensis TaxID=642074 RepID=A0ABD0XZR4_9HEMI
MGCLGSKRPSKDVKNYLELSGRSRRRWRGDRKGPLRWCPTKRPPRDRHRSIEMKVMAYACDTRERPPTKDVGIQCRMDQGVGCQSPVLDHWGRHLLRFNSAKFLPDRLWETNYCKRMEAARRRARINVERREKEFLKTDLDNDEVPGKWSHT